jgi:FkbM family methyltransferase
MKRQLKAALQRIGLDIVRHVPAPDRPFDVLGFIIREYLRGDQEFFFVQIGANDGVSNDPLREHVLRHGLTGLLVEPLPDLFALLKENYSGQSSLIFEQCAIGRFDGDATFYRVRNDPALPRWLQGLGSFDRTHLSSSRFPFARLERYVDEISVPCLTLTTLLARHGVVRPSLLQVDTEGFDTQIVRMALESGLRPPIINYEHLHADRAERAACKRLLVEAGYHFIDIGGDTLALLQDSACR